MDRKIVSICNELVTMLDKICDSEEKRTGVRPSYKTSSKILVMRINNVGGLKE